MRFAYTYRSPDKELYLFRFDVAENVVTESPWASEELGLVGRKPYAAVNLGLKKAKRTYEVCNLEKSVFVRFNSLREFNWAWQSSGGDLSEKVGDRFLATVVIDLYIPACGEHFLVSKGEVGKLAFKGGCHLWTFTRIPFIDGETMVREIYLAGESHHAMEYSTAEIASHETESIVTAQDGPGMETQILDADFLKPSRKLCSSRFNRNPLVMQDKSKYVKTRCRGRFAKDSRFVHKQTQCVTLSHRLLNKSDGNCSSSLKAEDFPRITTTPILRSTSRSSVSNRRMVRKGASA